MEGDKKPYEPSRSYRFLVKSLGASSLGGIFSALAAPSALPVFSALATVAAIGLFFVINKEGKELPRKQKSNNDFRL